MTGFDNVGLVEAFCATWATRDPLQIAEYLSGDCFYHNMPIEPVVGRENIIAFLSSFLGMADAVEFVILAAAQASDGAVLTERVDRFRIGSRWAQLRVMGIFEIADGKIIKWRDYYDQAEMSAQLGPENGGREAA